MGKVTQRIAPIILSGGSGTRLWPLSTAERPKQFLELYGKGTMIAQTMLRVADKDMFKSPVIVGAAQHEKLLKTSLAEAGIRGAKVILEPCPRNTAPAIALGALHSGEEELCLVMPSDHVIRDNDAFLEAVTRAVPAALEGRLVTFGIDATAADTGFGYIRAGEALEGVPGAFDVETFIEKPEEARLRQMLDDGGYCWNAGIFLFKSVVFLAELERFHSQVFEAAKTAIQQASKRNNIITPYAKKFAASPSISVDNAVMGLSDKVAMVPMFCGWCDLGSWDALAEIGEKDEAGNVIIGSVRAEECSGNFVNANECRVSLVGVRNMVVVVSGDEVLIMPRGQSQHVKDLAR